MRGIWGVCTRHFQCCGGSAATSKPTTVPVCGFATVTLSSLRTLQPAAQGLAIHCRTGTWVVSTQQCRLCFGSFRPVLPKVAPGVPASCMHSKHLNHSEATAVLLSQQLRLAHQIAAKSNRARKFIDRVTLEVKAGAGGAGCVSIWHSNAKGKLRPADGGNGGQGGDIIVEASEGVKTLRGINSLVRAQPGGPGGKQKQIGSRGQDAIVKVPLGTTVSRLLSRPAQAGQKNLSSELGAASQTDLQVESSTAPLPEALLDCQEVCSVDEVTEAHSDEAVPQCSAASVQGQLNLEMLADLVSHGQRVLVAHGGQGGRGNAAARSRQYRPASREASRGEPGECVRLVLELKTIADVGLVGLPNAGKSTLLHAVSNAQPEVGAYPFTTLHPQLGTVPFPDGSSLVVADIPGLIAGAAANRGLGHAFLRHIERTRALAYVLDMSRGLAGDDGPQPWEQLDILQNELGLYAAKLLEVPFIIVANKMDAAGTDSSGTLGTLRRHIEHQHHQAEVKRAPHSSAHGAADMQVSEGVEVVQSDNGQHDGGHRNLQACPSVVPVSALTGQGVPALVECLCKLCNMVDS